MVLIVYDSKTGNVKRFIGKLNKLDCVQITDGLIVDEPFVLVTYTTGFGQVPASTAQFLDRCGYLMRAVAASGNRNWGARYGLAADQVAAHYQVPILMKFELSGTSRDVERFYQEVNNHVYAAV